MKSMLLSATIASCTLSSICNAQTSPKKAVNPTVSQSTQQTYEQPQGQQPELLDNSNQRTPIDLGADGAVLMLMGSLADSYETGFGLGLRAMANVSPNIMLGGSVGYFRHSLKTEVKNISGYLSIVPIIGVVQHGFVNSTVGPFVGSDLGFYQVSVTIKVAEGSLSEQSSQSKSYLGIAPFGGYRFALNDGLSVDLKGKLQIVDSDGSENYKTFQALAGLSKSL
jgi:opacity protein-like surface antigen